VSVSGHSDYAIARSQRRQADRERIHVHVLHPIDTPSLIRDPLSHRTAGVTGALMILKLLAVAMAVHAMIIVVLYAVNELAGEGAPKKSSEIVTVQVLEPVEPKPVPPIPDDEPEAAIVPDFGVEPPEPIDPEPLPPPKPAKQKKPKPKPKKVEVAPPPPGAPKADDAPPPRYRPGISMESTVKGGKGPAMATGSSRMGKTGTRARRPEKGKPNTSGQKAGTGTGTQVGEPRQRKASNIPTQRAVFVKPKRVKPSEPPFPKTLEAQGIEGDVKVRVSFDPQGQVTGVTILGPSGHRAFDEAARKAAWAERFRPATRDGKPVSYTLSYSYRFRIEEK